MIINIGIQTVLALAIAVLMHRLTQSVVVRSIVLLPWLVPNAVLALLWMWMLDPEPRHRQPLAQRRSASTARASSAPRAR